MISKKYTDHIKENRIFHRLDKVILIIVPFLFILAWYIVDYFIADAVYTNATLISSLIAIVSIMFVLQTRALERDVKHIESMVKEDVDSYQLQKIKIWKQQKNRFIYYELVPVFFLLILALIGMSISSDIVNRHIKEASIALIIIYLYLFGYFRLRAFKDYMNELILTYQSMVNANESKVKDLFFIKYEFNRIHVEAIIFSSLLVVITYFLFLKNATVTQLILFVFAVAVVYVLVKGLFCAIKGFDNSLVQIDKLRSFINQEFKT